MNNKKFKNSFIYVAIIVLLGFGVLSMYQMIMKQSSGNLRYSDVVGFFKSQQVNYFDLDVATGELSLNLKPDSIEQVEQKINEFRKTQNPKAKDIKIKYRKLENTNEQIFVYKVPSAALFLETVTPYIEQYNTANPDNNLNYNLDRTPDNSWIFSMLPMLLLIGISVFFFISMMKQSSGGGKMSLFSKSNVKNPVKFSGKKTTFEQVAGADEEKQELEEVVEFLKSPKKFTDLGARIPKGILLIGPPGTGKTLLARAVAGEASVPFFQIAGSDFVEMFVGMGASRVRELFENAKKNAPALIFIDEIDAVGRRRGSSMSGANDEREQTLNQLLVEMDGFGDNQGVIVIAATNRRDVLDPALLRPGRFDRQVTVNYPDVKGREEILRVHSKNKPLGFDVDLKTIAKSTIGFTGADLENLLNEAALIAARNNRKAITGSDIQDATMKVIAGPEKKSKIVTEKDRNLTAYHEAGHAICTYCLETQPIVHEVSIIPRGMAGGYTVSLPSEDKSYMSKIEMEEEIVSLLGGRVAEQIILEDISTGASNDLQRSTKIARAMVTDYGFSEKLGPVVYGEDNNDFGMSNRNYSEEIAKEIDEEIRNIVDIAYETAINLLESNIDKLHELAKYLLENDKIDAETFKAFMEGTLKDLQDEKAVKEFEENLEKEKELKELENKKQCEQLEKSKNKQDIDIEPEIDIRPE